MNPPSARYSLTPFFFAASRGESFALHFAPAASDGADHGVLLCPPFAEEMNKCRRMATLQAQHLAAAGCQVLLPDLYGTGDSAGDFGDARWEIWLEDLQAAADWLQARGCRRLTLWGVRLGAALALSLAGRKLPVTDLLLWQPVMNGKVFLTQLLRLRLAAGMMRGQDSATVKQLREQLAAEGHLEIAGYRLHRELADALERIDLRSAELPPGVSLHGFEIGAGDSPEVSPALAQLLERWPRDGAGTAAAALAGEAFWQTPEIATVPALLSRSVQSLLGSQA